MVTTQMKIPKRSIGHVIGGGGKTIKRIKKISGAEIGVVDEIVDISAENSDSLTIAKEWINKVISNPTTAKLEMDKLPIYKNSKSQLLDSSIKDQDKLESGMEPKDKGAKKSSNPTEENNRGEYHFLI